MSGGEKTLDMPNSEWVVRIKDENGDELVVSGHGTRDEAIKEAKKYPRNADEVVWVTSPQGDTVYSLKDADVDGSEPN